jgi:hypothetical protein
MLSGMMATEQETVPKKKSRFRNVLSSIGRMSNQSDESDTSTNTKKKKKKNFGYNPDYDYTSGY